MAFGIIYLLQWMRGGTFDWKIGVQALGHFQVSQNFRFENIAMSSVDQKSYSDDARSCFSVSASSRNGNVFHMEW